MQKKDEQQFIIAATDPQRLDRKHFGLYTEGIAHFHSIYASVSGHIQNLNAFVVIDHKGPQCIWSVMDPAIKLGGRVAWLLV